MVSRATFGRLLPSNPKYISLFQAVLGLRIIPCWRAIQLNWHLTYQYIIGKTSTDQTTKWFRCVIFNTDVYK